MLVEDVDSRLDSQFSLQLVCIDNGNPKKSAVETVTFVVTRVTQLVPQFTQANYTVQVAEDVPTGSLIEQVEAIIENDSTNSVIYQIESGNELTWFTINQQTGEKTYGEIFFVQKKTGEACNTNSNNLMDDMF